MALPDIVDRSDVEALVRAFYGRCFEDDLLHHIFVDVAQLDLDEHLPTMTDFWMTVLFKAGLYRGNVLSVHVDLNEKEAITDPMLDRWLELWVATVSDMYAGPVAELAVTQSKRFAWSMSQRLAGGSGSELMSVTRGELVKELPTPGKS